MIPTKPSDPNPPEMAEEDWREIEQTASEDEDYLGAFMGMNRRDRKSP